MAGHLEGRVALVTGASRGVGKGIATALGESGATVYLTARSVRDRPSGASLPGTLEETAEAVAAAGGTAVPVRCDHREDEQVRAAFERIDRERGRLDVLVNSAWGGYELIHRGAYDRFVPPFWEQPAELWDSMFASGGRVVVAAELAEEYGFTDTDGSRPTSVRALFEVTR